MKMVMTPDQMAGLIRAVAAAVRAAEPMADGPWPYRMPVIAGEPLDLLERIGIHGLRPTLGGDLLPHTQPGEEGGAR